MILDLKRYLPTWIHFSLNTLRIGGNYGAHGMARTTSEVKTLIPTFTLVLDWFIKNKLQRNKTTKKGIEEKLEDFQTAFR